MNENYLTVTEITQMLRVHRNTVDRWLKEGIFPDAFNIQGTIRIPRSNLDRLKVKYTKRLKGSDQVVEPVEEFQETQPPIGQEPEAQELIES